MCVVEIAFLIDFILKLFPLMPLFGRAIRKVDKDLEGKLRENLKAARQAYIPVFRCWDQTLSVQIVPSKKFVKMLSSLARLKISTLSLFDQKLNQNL